MQIEQTELPGVLIVKPDVYRDPRGFFLESYNQEAFRAQGIDTVFVQDNHSRSRLNTLRGLHFQLEPAGQVKLLRVVRGAIWDVAVDIRVGSPTFGQWCGVELSEDNFLQLYIPVGFAHGFCVLSDEADVLYKTSYVYSKQHERGVLWDDPQLGVRWPVAQPVLSERDQKAPTLADYVAGTPFVYQSDSQIVG